MSNQIVISSGAKVRSLNGVITGTTGVLDALPINAANGIPQLDVNGKILVSQLPNSVMEYKGTWNANTNTPTLTNGGAFNQGDVYLCNVAGTTDFGAGPIAFVVGDQVIYSGSIWQRASGSTGTVTSVAVTETGDALTITGSPITTSGTINVGFAGTSLQYVSGNGALVTFPTLISSIGLSMPSAFSVANSPLTANGTLAVTGAGVASQYIRGDGTLADFPTSGGGGSSVSYYLNGGTSQGVIGGTTYYEMSKTADTGTGVDFPKTGNGLIVSFLTDANDPAQLTIPSGNWNYEIYVSMSANGGTPQLYAELYKYDGTTFTLISTSTNEILYDGTTLNLYTFAMAVPTTTLTVTDRLAVKLYATNSGGKTTTVHTQNGHLCQIITTFSTGITALNGLTAQVQYFQVGTSGTDFNISSATATHTFNLPTASAANRGALSSADWTTFNNKASTADLANYLPLTGGTLSGLLDISTASYLTSRLKLTNTATGGNIWSVSSGNANNSINNSLFTIINETLSKNTFVLSPTGKLAIGENLGSINPADALSVYDTNTILRVFDLTGNGSSVVLQATNTASYVNAGYNTTAIPLILRTANTTRLTIAATGEATFAAGLTGTTANFTGQLTLGSTITNGTYTYTLPSATGTLALTSDIPSLTGYVTGTGTSGQVTYFNGTSSVTSSSSFKFDGTNLTIGNPSSALAQLHIYNASAAASFLLQTNSTTDYSEIAVRNNSSTATSYFRQYSTAATGSDFGISRAGLALFFSNYATNFAIGTRNGGDLILGTNDVERARMFSATGNLTLNSSSDAGYKLDVNGTGRFTNSANTATLSLLNNSGYPSIINMSTTTATSTARNWAIFTNGTNWGDLEFKPSAANGGDPYTTGTVALRIASTGAATFSSTTSSSTTANGALVVAGGVGIGGEVNIAGTTIFGVSASGNSKFYIYGGFSAGVNLLQNYSGSAYTTEEHRASDYIYKIGTTEAMRITSAGNVGFSTSSPQYKTQITNTSANNVTDCLALHNGSNAAGTGTGARLLFKLANFESSAETRKYASIEGISTSDYNEDIALVFKTKSNNADPTERMRITSGGNVLANKTVTGQVLTNGFEFNPTDNYLSICNSTSANYSLYVANTGTSGTRNMVAFYGTSSIVGSITYNGTTTLYNATSDYRLKEDLKDYNGLEIVSKLKTYDFKWKEAGVRDYGMMAHELQEVLPNYVSGEKDALNEDGTIKTQGVDYSKLVPILVKSIQELEARLKTIENK